MNSILVVLSPSAEGREGESALEAWQSLRPRVELRRTTDASDARRWAGEAAEKGIELVVAGGGDGTVHEVANGILEFPDGSTALGIVPLGTGNDLARELGIPLDPEDAIQVLETGSLRSMDVVRVSLDGGAATFVVNAVTGGFSGQIHEALDSEMRERWGPLSYLRSGVEMWGERRTYRLELEVEGEAISEVVLNFMVCNGAFAGGGIRIAPGADPFDGLLDIGLIRDAPVGELATLAAEILSGQPMDHAALVRRKTRSAYIRVDAPVALSLDGEPTEASEIAFEIRPGRLPVIVPRSGGR